MEKVRGVGVDDKGRVFVEASQVGGRVDGLGEKFR